MYQNAVNVIQRTRRNRGLTQEALAERIGCSDDSVRAWECGARCPSLDSLETIAVALDAPWLPGIFLREQTSALNDLLPEFDFGKPLAQAAAGYVAAILELVDHRVDRRLLQLVADGRIDEVEKSVFAEILDLAATANRAYYEMLFAGRNECER